MFRSLPNSLVVTILCVSLIGIPVPARSAVIGTGEYLSLQDREVRVERVREALMQDRVRVQLIALGVDPDQARERVILFSDAELATLDGHLRDLPAGAGALELVLAVFLVFLILDLMGVTDLFPTIGPGKTTSSKTTSTSAK